MDHGPKIWANVIKISRLLGGKTENSENVHTLGVFGTYPEYECVYAARHTHTHIKCQASYIGSHVNFLLHIVI